MKNAKKLLAFLLAASMMLVVATGCGNSDSSTPAANDGSNVTEPANEGTDEPSEEGNSGDGVVVSVNLASEPHTMDPNMNETVDGAIMAHHFFENLMRWEDDGSGNAQLTYGQAESYEVEELDDGRVVYTFKLRDDIFWSDGEPVTAADFEFSWKRIADPETGSAYMEIVDMLENAMAINEGEMDKEELGIKAIDDKTLEVTLYYNCPYFIEIAAFPAIMPLREDIISAAGDQWTFDLETYITNGPYKMAEWNHDEVIVAVKNDKYYDYEKLGPDTINFVLMDDANAMLTGFNNGELDFIENFPADEIESLLNNGEIDVYDYIGTYFVAFNNEEAPFDDARVREAFTLAIDSHFIVNQITLSGEAPATGWVPEGIYDADGVGGATFREVGGAYDFYSDNDEEYQANLERARGLLTEAGFEGGEGFPLVTYIYNTNDRHRAIAEALQSMWQTELGVTVQLENMEWGSFVEARNNGEFSICRHGWIGDYNDPITFLDMWVTGNGNNDANHSNADYDAAIMAAKSTDVASERMAAMHEAEDVLMNETFGIAPVYFYTNPFMLADDIEGLYYTPLGYFFFDRITR